ncbi:MAG TPA: site-specific DNA-methyltransferase [Candidatus Binataceae bacterium]|nr:site-specific DNA-methyltransferase [Candidatus Binataceae bacterium]
MASNKKTVKRPIDNYTHPDKQRLNNPPVGLVTPDTDKDAAKKTYVYDPHLDPKLDWAGKAENTSFEIPTVSLHVHERIDPRSIVQAVKKRNGTNPQLSLFASPKENPPIREAIEFYKHKHNWSNRLIAGDSLLVMNSLVEKEGMAGQVQMVYIDPPYGIKYGSNFQPFVNKREVKDGKDEDLTQEPEMIRAFRDTWELGVHSYLTYLRDRLLLARELLHESGSCFVQISDENIHHVKELLDEIFLPKNFCGIITYRTTGGQSTSLLSVSVDYLIWFAKDKEQARTKFRQLTRPKVPGELGATQYTFIEPRNGSHDPRPMDDEEFEDIDALLLKYRVLAHDTLYSQGAPSDPADLVFEWRGEKYKCPSNTHWKPGVKSGGMQKLADANRLMLVGNTLRYKRYIEDNPVSEIDNVWNDTAISGFGRKKRYVVETNQKVVERCILLTTDPGDLVFDPTCGSGTTAFAAEKWGRRWITCDTSRVALALTKERLMTASFPYFELAHPQEGVGSGFKYETVPHIQLGSIANIPESLVGLDQDRLAVVLKRYADRRPLYDRPQEDKKKARVTGPFTFEAVPAPVVRPIDEIEEQEARPADDSVGRDGETRRQGDWRDELLKTGIRGKGGQRIGFSRVEPLAGTRWLHADAETKADKPQRVVASFGPDHAPLESRQVALAIEEAQQLVPKPKIIVFAAFQFDPEAAKDIDETKWPGVTLIKAQMNADLLTEDLKKKRASNESFWLIGQPDVEVEKIAKGDAKGKWRATVNGFDYYNTVTGTIESGGSDKIAVWMLDPDYDGRSLFPRQVFFPMAGPKDAWSRLAKSLKAEIDEELIEAYRGTVSLPFDAGEHKRAAIKIIDDRGIESFRVIGLD